MCSGQILARAARRGLEHVLPSPRASPGNASSRAFRPHVTRSGKQLTPLAFLRAHPGTKLSTPAPSMHRCLATVRRVLLSTDESRREMNSKQVPVNACIISECGPQYSVVYPAKLVEVASDMKDKIFQEAAKIAQELAQQVFAHAIFGNLIRSSTSMLNIQSTFPSKHPADPGNALCLLHFVLVRNLLASPPHLNILKSRIWSMIEYRCLVQPGGEDTRGV